MSNKIGELIQDIAYRLGDLKMNNYPPAVILRAMRRVYEDLNRDKMVIVRDITVNDTNYSNFSTNGYIDLPTDWIRPFKFDEYCDFRPWEVYDDTEDYCFSIHNNRLYISNASEDSEYVVSYYSSGYTLVDAADADVGTGEVNEPEYPDYLQQILLYGTCVDLSSDYPKFEVDLRKFIEMKSALGDLRTFQQAVTPETAGPKQRKTIYDTSDPYA